MEDPAVPEQDSQDVGHQQHQAHVGGEALRVLGPVDVSVLRDVGHHPAEHDGTRGDPRHQRAEHGHNMLERLILHVQLRF